MMLTPNFSLNEFTRTKFKVANIPDAQTTESLRTLCKNVMEPVRKHFRSIDPRALVIITSGFRCPEVNRLAGGAPTSQHLKGEAGDFHVTGFSNDKVWRFIVDNLDYDQCIAEKLRTDDGQAGWIHCSYSKNNRKESLSFLGNKKYVPGLVYINQQ